MNILIITGSPRRQGNTELMAEEFAKTAAKEGHQVVTKKLSEKKVNPCLACQYCFSHDGVCIQKDDMNELLSELDQADMLILAAPIYWFDISAQMKCFIDRMYAFAKKGFRVKSIAMLLNAGADGVFGAAQTQLNIMANYMNWEVKGFIQIPNVKEKGSILSSAELTKVYELARNLSCN